MYHLRFESKKRKTSHLWSAKINIKESSFTTLIAFLPGIVKKSTIPQKMFPSCTIMEEAWIGTIKLIKTIQYILWSVGMHNIKKNDETIGVGDINQLFQFLRITKSAKKMSVEVIKFFFYKGSTTALPWNCVETGDLISKASVIGMFHNCHKLDCIVTWFQPNVSVICKKKWPYYQPSFLMRGMTFSVNSL